MSMTDEQVEEFLLDSWASVRIKMDEIVAKYAPTMTSGNRIALVSEILAVEPF